MLRKPAINSREDVPDVPADDPVGTMNRFAEGLRRVLAAPKINRVMPQKRRAKKRRRAP